MNYRNFARLVMTTWVADVYGALLSFLPGRAGESSRFGVEVAKPKATLRRILRSFGDDGESGVRVNGGHICGFARPVVRTVLNYAECVDPQILYIESASDVDCVLKSVR